MGWGGSPDGPVCSQPGGHCDPFCILLLKPVCLKAASILRSINVANGIILCAERPFHETPGGQVLG